VGVAPQLDSGGERGSDSSVNIILRRQTSELNKKSPAKQFGSFSVACGLDDKRRA